MNEMLDVVIDLAGLPHEREGLRALDAGGSA